MINFWKFLEMHDKWAQAESARKTASQLIRAAGNGQFSDLANFQMMTYTNDELDDLGITDRNWVGQYSAGSVDSERGAVVLINIDAHKGNLIGMTDTILHEMGHACWELVDDQAKQIWLKNQIKHRWGAEEAFADDFMHFCRNEHVQMNNKPLFLQLTEIETHKNVSR